MAVLRAHARKKAIYRPAPKKNKAAVALTAGVLVLSCFCAVCGILTADHNSRLVGLGQARTELALRAGNDRLSITLMGSRFELPTGGITRFAREAAGDAGRLSGVLSPPPARLTDMLCRLAGENWGTIRQQLRSLAEGG